jgi:hypothetical protein
MVLYPLSSARVKKLGSLRRAMLTRTVDSRSLTGVSGILTVSTTWEKVGNFLVAEYGTDALQSGRRAGWFAIAMKAAHLVA